MQALKFILDTPQAVPVGHGAYVLKGWCYAPHNKSQPGLFLQIGDDVIPIQGLRPRPDVAAHENEPEVVNCGFGVRFAVRPGRLQAAIYAEIGGNRLNLADNIPLPPYSPTSNAALKVATYADWIRLKEPHLFAADWKRQAHDTPCSLLCVISSSSDLAFLPGLVNSVAKQVHQNWELLIASISPAIELPTADKRIRVLSGVTYNDALAVANGKLVVLLHPSHQLQPDALAVFTSTLKQQPASQILYSDGDVLDEYGIRTNPVFKPAFDYDRLLAGNYIGRCFCFTRNLAAELAEAEAEPNVAWAFLLRAAESLPRSAIAHIAAPLYHERSNPTPLRAKALRKVLENRSLHTEEIHAGSERFVVEEGLYPGIMRLRRQTPDQLEISVFLRPDDGVFQSAVVQENAHGHTLHLHQFTGSCVYPDQIRGSVCIFINGPLESLNHFFFEELAAQALRKDCGVITGLAVDTQNRILSAGWYRTPDNNIVDPFAGASLNAGGYMDLLDTAHRIAGVAELFFAVRSEILDQIGGVKALNANRMALAARQLAEYSLAHDLAVLYTPYAVATFSESCKAPARPHRLNLQHVDVSLLNPQIFEFQNVNQLLQSSPEAFPL